MRLAPLSTTVVPALTPVLLKGNVAGEIGLQTAAYIAPITTGWQGVLTTTPSTALNLRSYAHYAMARSSAGDVRLMRFTTGSMPANQIYFTVPNTKTAPKQFILVFESAPVPMSNMLTPVENVLAPKADNVAPLYDLSGRRVARPVSSQIYLQNGHKVLFP